MNTYDNLVSFKVTSSVERVSTFEHTRLLLVWGVFVFPVFGIVGIVYTFEKLSYTPVWYIASIKWLVIS